MGKMRWMAHSLSYTEAISSETAKKTNSQGKLLFVHRERD